MLITLWYVAPRFARLPIAQALVPLLFLHTFRTVGLVFLVPGVVGTRLPDEFAIPAAYGDLLAAILALSALLALHARWRTGLVFVWVFSIEGAADLLYAFFQGARINIAGGYTLGPAWFILTFMVPSLLVTHLVIFWLLLRPRHSPSVTTTNSNESKTPVAIGS